MIVFRDVKKSFGRMDVLSDVNVSIDPGEFVCVTGPSGAGKSTFLNLILGAQTATKGIVEVDGIDIKVLPAPILQLYRRRIGVVFQDYKLLANRTVYENIAFPLEVCGVDRKTIDTRVHELVTKLAIAHRAQAFPHELSGGEKSRVAIARAIVHWPMIIIADEPTGTLEQNEAMNVLEILQGIHKEGKTVIVATHDPTIVDRVSGRVLRIESGRIARDSGRHSSKPSEDSHQIFAGAEDEIPKQKAHSPADKRRIKITSIHS